MQKRCFCLPLRCLLVSPSCRAKNLLSVSARFPPHPHPPPNLFFLIFVERASVAAAHSFPSNHLLVAVTPTPSVDNLPIPFRFGSSSLEGMTIEIDEERPPERPSSFRPTSFFHKHFSIFFHCRLPSPLYPGKIYPCVELPDVFPKFLSPSIPTSATAPFPPSNLERRPFPSPSSLLWCLPHGSRFLHQGGLPLLENSFSHSF